MYALSGPLRRRYQPDGGVQAVRIMKIRCRDVAYAGYRNSRCINCFAKGNTRQDSDLVAGIQTIDVESRFSLGISCGLRLFQRLVETGSVLLHLREDVITGAVQDAINRLD